VPDPLEDPTQLSDDAQRWPDIGEGLAAGVAKHVALDDIVDAIARAIQKGFDAGLQSLTKKLIPIARAGGEMLHAVEEPVLPLFAEFVAPIVAGMFGSEASAAAFQSRGNTGARSEASAALVDAFMAAIAGDASGELEPGDEGAKRIAGAAVTAALEGWFNGWILECLGECVPIEWLHFKDMTELSEEIIRALGVGRLVRRAISPLVDVTCALPMKWQVNTAFRPTMLGAGTIARQVARGRMTADDARAELAKDGYSDERIDALLNEASKFHSDADLFFMVRSGQMPRDSVKQLLQDAGWAPDGADTELTIAQLQDIHTFERAMADAAIAAYADGRVDAGVLDTYTHGTTIGEQEGAQLRELAQAKRALRAQPLTSSEARQAVKARILNVSDYVAALEREGRTSDAALVLELLLRHELDDQQSAEDLRAAAAADRAKAAADNKAAADAKRQAIADALALKRRGALTELEHAVVVGLIPIARLEEVLNASFDSDTVGIYVADVEQQRAAYVEQQKERDDAAKRADAKGLNVGQLEQAVYTGVLTVDQFSARARAYGLSADDAALLAATVTAKLADLNAAKKRQAEAAAAAAKKGIDLGRLEQLVERGLRTLAQYDAQLVALGFDDAARAGMRELLQSKVDERAAAAALRKKTTTTDTARGLSLEQFRKAVIAGTKTLDAFQTYLVEQKYSADAIAVLVDELSADVELAAAAQQRRDQADAASGRAGLSVTTAARAARLGIITPDAYRGALEAAGYSSDDIDLELELLVAEMATTKASQKVEKQTATPTSTHGLNLAQIAAAVKAGAATRADYQSAAAAAGLGDDAVATLLAQLDDELAAVADAKGRRRQLVPALQLQGLDLADLENAVRARSLTVAAFEERLTTLGYPAADAQLVGSLLETELA
jgi:hypothetical protein